MCNFDVMFQFKMLWKIQLLDILDKLDNERDVQYFKKGKPEILISVMFIFNFSFNDFLFQPFRGNPDYDRVADLPYDSNCLKNVASSAAEINIHSINK